MIHKRCQEQTEKYYFLTSCFNLYGWLPMSVSQWLNQWPNLGATCFVKSVIQVLSRDERNIFSSRNCQSDLAACYEGMNNLPRLPTLLFLYLIFRSISWMPQFISFLWLI